MREGVILVVARAGDHGVAELARRAGPGRVALVEVRDLARPGWRYVAGAPEQLTAIAGERRVQGPEIAAVVMRLAHIGESDLPHIVPEDRAYVAAECQAFLRAALASLPCPVFNRPSPTSLSGPYWRAEQWVAAAAAAGIPVHPLLRRHDPKSPVQGGEAARQADATVTVIGERCAGSEDRRLRGYARDLAKRAGVALLGVSFTRAGGRWHFHEAATCPPITPEVAAALLAVCRSNAPRARRAA